MRHLKRFTPRALTTLGVVLALSPGRVAATPAAAVEARSPTASIFALVVGNNRSLAAAQPNLHYADDDAMKYGMLFHSLASPSAVHVLTRLDAASAELYRDQPAPGGLPTQADLQRATTALAAQVAAARAAGQHTTLYFVYAGHGDEDRGRGFLELEDARIDREGLTRLLQAVAPTRAHVLLDSCNSFFVIHPRRPGGRIWTSSAEIRDSLQVPGVDVGVFLSTSAEAQVYEWSQLQSGVFSHAVRSALLGAADADVDGRISYRELDAFVSTAARGIQNSLYRPHLYVRSPATSDVFLDLSSRAIPTVELRGFSTRLTLRDQRGIRVADLHPEPGYSPRLLAPADSQLTLLAEQARADGQMLLFEQELVATGPVTAPLSQPSGAARGSQALFAQYFELPFGPRSLAAFRSRQASEAPRIYGLTAQQASRFEAQLQLLAEESREARVAGSVTGILTGVGGALLSCFPLVMRSGVVTLDPADTRATALLAVPFIGLAGMSALGLLYESDAEGIVRDFRARRGEDGDDQAAQVARAAGALRSQAERSAFWRTVKGVGYGSGALLAGGLGTAALVFSDSVDDPEFNAENFRVLGVLGVIGGLVVGGAALAEVFNPTPEETTLEVMRQDPESVLRVEE